MAKLTPNIPYDDLGDSCQIADYHAPGLWSPAAPLLTLLSLTVALSTAGSKVLRRASFGDIEALAGELPMLSQRSYRIGSEQGIIVVEAAVIVCEASALLNRRYRWVVTLEPLIAVEVSDSPVVPRRVIDRFGVRGGVENSEV